MEKINSGPGRSGETRIGDTPDQHGQSSIPEGSEPDFSEVHVPFRLAAARLPQFASSSSGTASSSDAGRASSLATQSEAQNSNPRGSSINDSSTDVTQPSAAASSQDSVQPPGSEPLSELSVQEIVRSFSPRSRHYLHSRARAFSRGLRFVGEDRVGNALAEVVHRGELQAILLSAEELEAEATRVVPRPAGYPMPYDAPQASSPSPVPMSMDTASSSTQQQPTLPMPLPSQDMSPTARGAASGGRQSRFVPEDWSSFEAQSAHLQAELAPGNDRYVRDPFVEEEDDLEEYGPVAGPLPYQWANIPERIALMWLQDPRGTATSLRALCPGLYWRDIEDDPLLYHIKTEHPDPPPLRIYEDGQLVTVVRHWVGGGPHHTLCVLDIPEVNPWFLAEETRHIVIRSRYSPGGDFVHLLPVAARAAAVRISTARQGEGQEAMKAPSYDDPIANSSSSTSIGPDVCTSMPSVLEPDRNAGTHSGSLLQEFCGSWGLVPSGAEEIDWDADVHLVPPSVARLVSAASSPEDVEGVPDECDLLVCEVPVELDAAGADWLDQAQARLQTIVRMEGKQCLEEAVSENDGWIDSCYRLRSVARQVEAAIEDLERQGQGPTIGEVDLNPHDPDPQPDPEVLQTKIVPNHRVEQEIELWLPSMRDEYNGLLRAVDPLSEQTVREWETENREFELIPSKLIFSLKAPDARRKCRSVCCGNFTSGTSSREDKYSGGIDSVTMRCLLRFAGIMRFDVGVIDVKQAFLLAPLLSNGIPVVVKTPTIFRKHGICNERFWIVRHALYGLVQAPRSWSVHRDSVLSDMRIPLSDGQVASVVQLDSDPNVWAVRSEKGVQAWIAIYVDDLMVVGETPAVECVLDALMKEWKCTPPQKLHDGPVAFNGYELALTSAGILVHQGRYTRELLTRYPGEDRHHTPGEGAWPDTLDGENEHPDYLKRVRVAQQIAGELLWMSTHTRPDISYHVSLVGSLTALAPTLAYEKGLRVIAYLREKPDLGLLYGPPGEDPDSGESKAGSICACSDASYAPASSKSHGAYITSWAGSIVNWSSRRQSYITLSTAEAELGSLCDSGQAVQSILPLVQELLTATRHGRIPVSVDLRADSTAAIALTALPGGTWRTRHLRIKANWLRDRLRAGWVIGHMAGEHLAADALTKSLPRERFWYLIGLLGLQHAQAQLDAPNETSRPSPEAVRRALIAVLCLASVVPNAAQGCGGAKAGHKKGEEKVWMFWGLIVLVVVLAWEGAKLGIGRLRGCWCRIRRKGADSGVQTVGTQTDREDPTVVRACESGEGLRRRSPFHSGGAPSRVGEEVPEPPATPTPPPIPGPPKAPSQVAPPLTEDRPSSSAAARRVPDLPAGAPAPRTPTVPPPPPVLYGERILTTPHGQCFHIPGCTQLVHTRAPGVRRPCQLCFPAGTSKDTLSRINGIYGDPFMYHSIRRCGNEQGESKWLPPCCHCLPDPDRFRRRERP